MSKIISFDNVSLKFGGVQALKEISFDIDEGSLFAIIGPNGAGKTSILNCINGIYKPSSGKINIFGEDSANLNPDEIAKSYLHFFLQDRSSWSWELELRPWVENF